MNAKLRAASILLAAFTEFRLMAERKATKTRRASRPLCHAAKISDYRFRKVLWHFAADHSATDTAKATGLSLNSVAGIFRKLRVFFFEAGLFTDFHEGRDPLAALDAHSATFEHGLLSFHLARVRERNGLKSLAGEPDYHFAESHWRYHFHLMAAQRPDAPVQEMMFAHLLEIIRLCGPVGKPPTNLEAGLLAVLRQMDQRIAWLERNAPGFMSAVHRKQLKAIRD